jgi:hypothetical protein
VEPETARLLITVATSLLSGALGAGVAIYVSRLQHRHQTGIERERRHVGNLERLHKALSDLERGANTLSVHLITKLAYNQNPTKEEFADKIPSSQEARMLSDFYAPAGIREDLDQLNADYNKLAELVFGGMLEHTAGKMTDDGRTKALADSIILTQRIRGAVAKAQSALADTMRKIPLPT